MYLNTQRCVYECDKCVSKGVHKTVGSISTHTDTQLDKEKAVCVCWEGVGGVPVHRNKTCPRLLRAGKQNGSIQPEKYL